MWSSPGALSSHVPATGQLSARVGQGLKQACILPTLLLCSWLAVRSKSLVMEKLSQSPGQPPDLHGQGPVLKAGWLKKQRSIVKNWQQCWFMLRGNQLFYYKDEDEAKPQVRSTCSLLGTDHGGAPGRGSREGWPCPGVGGAQRPSCRNLHPKSPKSPPLLRITLHQGFPGVYPQPRTPGATAMSLRPPQLVSCPC